MVSTSQLTYQFFGQSDRGLTRSENEDALLLDPDCGLFAVADGLGGLPEGALASELAVDILRKTIRKTDNSVAPDFESVFQVVNRQVFAEGKIQSLELGIGTTLSALQLKGDIIYIGHVGDSGITLYRGDQRPVDLTKDHTMAQDMLDRLRPGEHAYIPEYFHHTLTRCIGQMVSLQCDTFQQQVKSGDRILLYTDGVTKTIKADEMWSRVRDFIDPQPFVEWIIKEANARGGPDNVTAIALFID